MQCNIFSEHINIASITSTHICIIWKTFLAMHCWCCPFINQITTFKYSLIVYQCIFMVIIRVKAAFYKLHAMTYTSLHHPFLERQSWKSNCKMHHTNFMQSKTFQYTVPLYPDNLFMSNLHHTFFVKCYTFNNTAPLYPALFMSKRHHINPCNALLNLGLCIQIVWKCLSWIEQTTCYAIHFPSLYLFIKTSCACPLSKLHHTNYM